MNIHFLDRATLGMDLDLEAFSTLGTLKVFDYTESAERQENLAQAQVAVANKVIFDRTLLEACPQLKLILLTATGYNTVDLVACKNLGIGVCNVKGYSTPSVVQHTLAMLLYLMEPLRFLDDTVQSGDYSRSRQFTHLEKTFPEVSGKVWGILGMGKIGRGVASVAQALGAKVLWTSTSGVQRDEPWPQVSLNELLQQTDILTIHAPLNDSTRNLLDEKELRTLKPKSYLINVGRGGIVNEEALSRVLLQGHLAGVGLDVMETEPLPLASPLFQALKTNRLYITPHVAWASVESRNRCMDEVRFNLESWLTGGSRNRVD